MRWILLGVLIGLLLGYICVVLLSTATVGFVIQ